MGAKRERRGKEPELRGGGAIQGGEGEIVRNHETSNKRHAGMDGVTWARGTKRGRRGRAYKLRIVKYILYWAPL